MISSSSNLVALFTYKFIRNCSLSRAIYTIMFKCLESKPRIASGFKNSGPYKNDSTPQACDGNLLCLCFVSVSSDRYEYDQFKNTKIPISNASGLTCVCM